MTVFDTSAVIDLLLDQDVAPAVEALLESDDAAAPDVLVFEVLAVLRRLALRGELTDERAEGALSDLGDMALDLVPSLVLCERAWALRHRLGAANALFAALAAELGEPLATKDPGLAAVAADEGVVVVALGS